MKRKILLGLFSMFVVITAVFFVSRDHARAEVANDVTSGLELQWKMNEDPGTADIADTSSNHNAGTLYNTDIFTSRSTDVPYHSGSNSHSLYLNSTDTNDYAQSNADVPDAVSSTMPRSLCGWVKLATTGGTQVAFNYGSQTTGGKFGIYSSGGRWWFWGFSSADLETTAVPDTNWHHHCVVYDGDILTYYYDGVSVGSASRSLDTGTSTRLIIGQRDANDWIQPMLGRVDDVRIYSRPLNQLEVRSLANLRSISINSKPAAASNDNTATFEFSSTGTVVVTTCSIDAGPPTSCTSPYASAPLTEGPHSFTVTATYSDATTASDTYTWTVDMTPPDTMLTRFGDNPVTTPTTDILLTSNEAGSFECNLDGGDYEPCSAMYTTPALTSGEHTILVRAIDNAGNVDPSPAVETWTVDLSQYDGDGDGITDVVENAGPNNGDANNDGTPDASQANVTTMRSLNGSSYIVVTTNCEANSNVGVAAESTAHADSSFRYPGGVVSFTASGCQPPTCSPCAGPLSLLGNFYVSCCPAPQDAPAEAQVTILFYDLSAMSGAMARKYDTASYSYNSITNATIQDQDIAGTTALAISYTVEDGSSFDADGTINNTIVDPVGVGLPVVGAPNTGL